MSIKPQREPAPWWKNSTEIQKRRVRELVAVHGAAQRVEWSPFDLPKGYLLVILADGYTAGVAPDGAIST